MQRLAVLLLLSTPCVSAAVPRGETALFILKNGQEIYGTLVLENRKYLFLKADNKIRQIEASAVDRTVPEAEIPAEYQRRRSRLGPTAADHYRLGVWCRTVGLIKEATELITAAVTLDPNHEGARKELDILKLEDTTRIPWNDEDPVAIRLEVKIRAGSGWQDDEAKWSHLKLWLSGARPPFTILPPGDKDMKAQYVVRAEIAAKVMKENRFYGEVVVSRTWEAKARLLVLDPKTLKRRFVLKPVSAEDTFSGTDPKAEGEICSRAFHKLLSEIKAHPGFRLVK